jgi:hypothetical protein
MHGINSPITFSGRYLLKKGCVSYNFYMLFFFTSKYAHTFAIALVTKTQGDLRFIFQITRL